MLASQETNPYHRSLLTVSNIGFKGDADDLAGLELLTYAVTVTIVEWSEQPQ